MEVFMTQSDCADIQAQKHDCHRIIFLYVNCCAYILIQQLRSHIDNYQIELSNINLLNCLKKEIDFNGALPYLQIRQ